MTIYFFISYEYRTWHNSLDLSDMFSISRESLFGWRCARSHSHMPVSAIYVHNGGRLLILQWRDILVTPAQYAGKYIILHTSTLCAYAIFNKRR